MKKYRVVIKSMDPADPGRHEILDLDGESASLVATEQTLIIRTNHDRRLGGWHDERHVPWHRVIDYRVKS